MSDTTELSQTTQRVFKHLCDVYPDADCELEPREPFRLLIAIVLSAQTTDVAVNAALPQLFSAYPNAEALGNADPAEVAEVIKTIGMYRQKSKYLVGLSKMLVEKHNGEVPADVDALIALPGVGRKTANVLLGVAFNMPAGVVVDTHVRRLSQRLGWTKQREPDLIEKELESLFEKSDWIKLSHVLIFHGRRVCDAKKPDCENCPVSGDCPSAGNAKNVGRKASTAGVGR